jgi:ubiquinone/menaquinone biosynthesis C-methylase UbiE
MEAEEAEGGIGMAEGKELVQEQFAKAAQEYVHSRTHGDPAVLQDFVHAIDPLPHWVCLDIATGGGHVAKALAQNVSRVVVTDLTRNMLAAAREYLEREGIRRRLRRKQRRRG